MTIPRILVVFSSADLGGAERSLSRMGLKACNLDIRLASLCGEGSWSTWIRAQHYEPILFSSAKNATSTLGIWRLIRYVRRHRIDILYICGARAALMLRLIRFLMPGTKLIHGIRWNPDSDSMLDRFFRFVERRTHRLIDGWIANSAIAKTTLVKRCGIPAEKVFVIHNGLEGVHECVMPQQMRPMEVLTVANLNPRKGHREYLQVIMEVVRQTTDAQFVFVGRDDMSGAIQNAVAQAGLSERVRWEGFHADVEPWLRRARVFVLPSIWNEGCPTSILEAMSFAVPCVAFAIDGIPELMKNGEEGLLLAPGDYRGMAAAIVRLLREPDVAERMGNQGRSRVATHFKIDNTIALHERAFRSISSGTV